MTAPNTFRQGNIATLTFCFQILLWLLFLFFYTANTQYGRCHDILCCTSARNMTASPSASEGKGGGEWNKYHMTRSAPIMIFYQGCFQYMHETRPHWECWRDMSSPCSNYGSYSRNRFILCLIAASEGAATLIVTSFLWLMWLSRLGHY